MTGTQRATAVPRAVPVLGLAVAAALLSACTSTPSAPAPARWEGGSGVVTLHDDGTGELEAVPFDGPRCGDGDLTVIDGEVTWEEVEPGTIRVEARQGSLTLWADRGGFGGDVSWSKLVVGPCGDRSTSDDVVVYTRDTRAFS